MTLPRLMVAAAASGQGKTTVAVGLMAALCRAGYAVAPAKVGPDYIDPGYHALATGRPGRNLDPWLCRPDMIAPLLAHGHLTPEPADLSIIEGVMGLHDGRLGTDGFASTAHIATLTSSPVVLVMDVSAAARTIAATVHGLASFDPAVTVAGVILNKVGSPRHAEEVQRSVTAAGYRVIGMLPRDAGVAAPSRHLGLVPVAERDRAVETLETLADHIAVHVDLEAVREIAAGADDLTVEPWTLPTRPSGPRNPVVAVAGGRAFTFRYAETEELMRAQGLTPVTFDPAHDQGLPTGTAGLYLGGGFPELHAAGLATNTALRRDIRDAVAAGVPTVAECAGLLYLCESLDGHDMVGALPARAAMHGRLRLRYHEAVLATDGILGPAGTTVRGHEFHRTRTTPAAGAAPAWWLDGVAEGFALDPAGTGRATVLASYLHTHWAGAPGLAEHFADAVHDTDAGRVADHVAVEKAPETTAPVCSATPAAVRGHDLTSLDHHGDDEIAEGLVDFAVNVRDHQPPAWLHQVMVDALTGVAGYPTSAPAREAIARRHRLPVDMVLPTNGGAEAFTLIAQAVRARRPVVVHPQFTEPEAALLAAGQIPEQVLARAEDGFLLHASDIPDDADLVMIGNPTNPTGVLHPRAVLDGLRRSGRTLVVDEAFMDAIPGESESMIGPDMTGVLVVRSLTKTWSVAGIRAGYVVGDDQLVPRLARQQPHWSVSSPAAAVMVATATDAAVDEAAAGAAETRHWRDHLVQGLTGLGLRPVPGHAPFVLVRVGPHVWERLREAGFAVRSAASFPGLGPDWVRIAVRDPRASDALLRALGVLVEAQR